MPDDSWLVVGLGNPGPSYVDTRHNVGHLVVELLAERAGVRLKSHRRGRSDVAEVRIGGLPGVRAALARPRSYMNLSGGPVSSLRGFFKIDVERLVVIHDDLDLPFGVLRLKQGGGDGGHKGLKSIRAALGTGDFHRVRFGIDRPPGRMDPAVYVLKPWSAVERKELDVLVDRAADAVEALVTEGLPAAQNRFNS
jgi:peptidyl-tRNA hydrolase, PTH1 family